MHAYERFVFESYSLDRASRTIYMRYNLDDLVHFEETFTLPAHLPLTLDHPDLDRALFALHLSGGTSYYKTYCPKVIEVRSGVLNASQAKFWNNLYTQGLGEFFYRNQLDFRGLIHFPVTEHTPAPHTAKPSNSLPKRALVPFGGGKDSIVSTEILRAAGIDQTLFRLRSHRLISELAHIADLPLVEVERTLAPELFEQNEAGAYNGHVPITAHISFLTIVISLLSGYDCVFFSNERSSSYGNVEYLGMQVNHQWSKSLEAERAIRSYIGSYITPDVRYLNAVRPLSELHIAQLFARHPEYFDHATSCNRNWTLAGRSDAAPRWCGSCPKCAFSFALLAAFMPAPELIHIFGHNLFENIELLPLYRELWGVAGFKPFECVGTPEEAQAACYLAMDQPGYKDTVVMRAFVEQVMPRLSSPDELIRTLMQPELDLAPAITREILSADGII